ncbi:hypothetical protein CHGG_10110 [Chaetomium globosum CBS 148.51]|uniref:ATPase AAA-type core domain-containing protein n=1 Tax=Chaetomium globosum (strain ATCC 6205 / CBS 148.51 / DSM 1962 / NBRC 6347 / NRRL 1970) TaxID=306901 RepID=Q2GPJ4_CHAGB|nr:uncharacterized protein CHGG_10110 [Chaetomium globosum CBS 148.51]EAQ83706.1 hypothetical protein CHGG_10110 [Chaetomium globosum CBS 148.51]
MTTPEDDSTRQETPNQPQDVTADRPSEDTQAPKNDSHKNPGDDSKPGSGSPDPDDSVHDSLHVGGFQKTTTNTKAPGSKTSNTDTDKKPDTASKQPPTKDLGPPSDHSPVAEGETSTDDGNLTDVSILTDAEHSETAQNATNKDAQKPSEHIDSIPDAVPNNYVSTSAQTDEGPEPGKESDNTVNHVEDDNVPAADEPPEPLEAETGNEPDNDNASVMDDTATVDDAPKADNEAPVDRTPEPSEAGDAPEADSEVDVDGDVAANKTPDVSEAGDTPTDSEPYEDSDITKRLRRMKDKSPSRKGLMLKFGLEEVKAHFLWVYDERQRAQGRDDELWDLTNLHTCFLEGGENTRTMVLNLYVKLLRSLGLVEADLVGRGKSGDYLGDTWEAATQDGNKGIFIVDTPEAENFSPLKDTLARRFKKSNAPRPPVVLFHIPHSAENATDYILESSDDVPSMHTIPVRQTEDDLLKTVRKEFKKELSHREAEGGWDGPIAQKFVRRAIKNGDLRTPNAVRESVDGIKERRRKRVEAEKAGRAPTPASTAYYIKSDFLGVTAAELGYQSATLAELEKMIGMEDVKQSVRELLAEASLSFRLELEGEPALSAWSNRRCPPAQKRASDLIGPYIGHSEELTQKAFKEARGGVLIIDDFHLLFPQTMHNTDGSDVFRAAVIDTIVAEIDPNTTRKEAIILIGYPDAMAEAFETSNPGLARRFPLTQAFRFYPYTSAQLTQILHLKLTTHNLHPTPTALRVAEDLLTLARHRPNFGNGGAIDNLLHAAQLAPQRSMRPPLRRTRTSTSTSTRMTSTPNGCAPLTSRGAAPRSSSETTAMCWRDGQFQGVPRRARLDPAASRGPMAET